MGQPKQKTTHRNKAAPTAKHDAAAYRDVAARLPQGIITRTGRLTRTNDRIEWVVDDGPSVSIEGLHYGKIIARNPAGAPSPKAVIDPVTKSKQTPRAFKSDAMKALHETMSGLVGIGALEKRTMRGLAAFAFIPSAPMEAGQIRALRERENVSQPVFAASLGVSKNVVSDWERGVKKPGGPASRLLQVVERHGIDILLDL